MKTIKYLTAVMVMFSTWAHAQVNDVIGKDLFLVGYEIAVPDMGDYLTKTSWNGARIDYRRVVAPNISVGIAFSFNAFEENFDKQTYQLSGGGGAITTDMIRQVYTAPILATAHYYFDGDKIRPYAGIGIGAQYSTQTAYFNIYNLYERNWGFAVRPEIGVIGKLGPNLGAFINAAFNYATNDNSDFGIKHLSHYPIAIGLVFTP